MNVGLVFYEPTTGLLCAKVISSTKRLCAFFSDLSAEYLLADLHYFAQRINGHDQISLTTLTPPLENITATLIRPNDGALQLMPVAKGLSGTLLQTFGSLYQRLVNE